jgi:hypothetical protein
MQLFQIRQLWITSLALCLAPLAVAETAADLNKAGVTHFNAKEWDAAIDAFSDAFRLAPDNEVIRRNLCNAYQAEANRYAKVADFKVAAEYLEEAIGIEPDNPSPLVQLGSYYLRLDMVGDAIYRLEDAVSLDGTNHDARNLLGDAYYKNNNLSSAVSEWEYVIDSDPEYAGLREKLDKAYREASIEGGFSSKGSRHFEISYPPGTKSRSLSRIMMILEDAYREVGAKFGGQYPPGPIQVVVYQGDDFQRATQLGDHVSGLYDGKIRVPLQDLSGRQQDANSLERVLFHEYVHVVVRFIAANNVPWWLNEGLAELFSRDLSDADRALLQAARESDALFSLADLESGQLERLEPDALRLAYVQSHATALHLWTRYGKRGLKILMTALAEGVDPQDALFDSCRQDYAAIEREVLKRYGRRS